MTRRNRVLTAVAVVVLVVAAVLSVPTEPGAPLDPRSRTETGLAAGIDVLRELGADVTIGSAVPDDPDAVLVLPPTDLTDEQLDAASSFVETGGRAVLLDPGSPLVELEVAGALQADVFGAVAVAPDCDLLDDVIEEVLARQYVLFEPPADALASCLRPDDQDGAALVAVSVGEGSVTVLGIPGVLTNDAIGDADHARLLAALALPDGADGAVTVLWDRPAGTAVGEADSLLDLVTARFWVPLGAVVLALLLLAWSRARRPGRPVDEGILVTVPGSELVLAIGDLLRRHGHVDQAAARLRADLRREVAAALQVPGDTTPDVLLELLRTHVPDLDETTVRTAVVDGSVTDDEGLVRVATATARVRDGLDGVGVLAADR